MSEVDLDHDPSPEQQQQWRPSLTFPPEESDVVKAEYTKARVILEYGSGGSTLLAADDYRKTIFSVESDLSWARRLSTYFEVNPPKAKVYIHAIDIGETKEWGNPVDTTGWSKYHRYPASIWSRPYFKHPDLILIDGRFRAACFVVCAVSIQKKTTILWDDYAKRKSYHEVERWFLPVAVHGRMARFEITPRTLDPAELLWFLKQFSRVL